MILFAIAVTIHVASIFDLGTADIHVNRFWTVYLWTVPLSCLLIAFFVKRTFHSKTMMLVWLSVFVWTILAAAFISFLYKGVYWFLFFIGVPFQAAIILMARIKQ